MTDQNSGADAAAAPPSGAPTQPETAPGAQQPPVTVLAQYVKDLSFENPRAPTVFASPTAPQSAASVSVQVNHLGERNYEVVLNLQLKGSVGNEPAYLVEVVYAGLFAIGNVADEMVEPLLMVEAPRLLFPFARGVAATVTREGGFPQVLINPIDFASLYRGRRRQRNAQPAASTA